MSCLTLTKRSFLLAPKQGNFNRKFMVNSFQRGIDLFGGNKNSQGSLFLQKDIDIDADVAIIGGGSGGISCANSIARKGKKVVLFDYVSPSLQGTKWGFGGTCVNVGCIPKKLMHEASLLREQTSFDAEKLGLQLEIKKDKHVDWTKLVSLVQNYVKSLNFSYYAGLHENVQLVRSHASFKDENTLRYSDPISGNQKTISPRDSIVIAVGGRPDFPSDCCGAEEFGINSDDIFSLAHTPGKTLCVGGSYVSLEVAGFLNGLGFETTVAARSIFLRGEAFDSQCADKIEEILLAHNVNVKKKTIPTKIEKVEENKLQVTFSNGEIEVFDTVFFGTGRSPHLQSLGLENTSISVSSSKKIKVNSNFQTDNPKVYAIGDAAETGLPELTPVAIRQGELVADHVVEKKEPKLEFESLMVPSTIFTPIEYGRIGLSESAAQKFYGNENIETYLHEWQSLSLSAIHRQTSTGSDYPNRCLAKIVCLKRDNNRVVGLHFVGPNAGEVIQGFALAVNLGAKKDDFRNYVLGIHPTDAEGICNTEVSRSSGEDFVQSGGCGGGKCG